MRSFINQTNMEMHNMRQYMRDHSYEQKFPEMMNRDFYRSTPFIEESPIGSTSFGINQKIQFDWDDKFLTKPFWKK